MLIGGPPGSIVHFSSACLLERFIEFLKLVQWGPQSTSTAVANRNDGVIAFSLDKGSAIAHHCMTEVLGQTEWLSPVQSPAVHLKECAFCLQTTPLRTPHFTTLSVPAVHATHSFVWSICNLADAAQVHEVSHHEHRGPSTLVRLRGRVRTNPSQSTTASFNC